MAHCIGNGFLCDAIKVRSCDFSFNPGDAARLEPALQARAFSSRSRQFLQGRGQALGLKADGKEAAG